MAAIWKDEKRNEGEISQAIIKRIEAVKEIISTIPEEDVNREGLLDTPKRVAKMYEELFAGYEMDPTKILSAQFDAGYGTPQMIRVKDIHFCSLCEHHMMPFFGTVDITYTPDVGGKVIGLSKLGRLVECFARRLQIQERMGMEIGNALGDAIHPLWIDVRIIAEHTCMTARGVNKPGSKTETVYHWQMPTPQVYS